LIPYSPDLAHQTSIFLDPSKKLYIEKTLNLTKREKMWYKNRIEINSKDFMAKAFTNKKSDKTYIGDYV